MSKLSDKIFYTIFIILTLSVLSFIAVFNIQNYIEELNKTKNNLNISISNEEESKNKNTKNQNKIEKENFPLEENVKFMDHTIYTILLDEDNNIKEIINHSSKEDNTNIKKLAQNILNQNPKKESTNLYFDNYSYAYSKNNYLIILDNTTTRESLVKSFSISLLLFILLEGIIILLSNIVTNFITRPVKESFERQKRFIADASHELKTPLSVIIASIDAYETTNDKKWINNTKNEIERMNGLITNLLELSTSEYKDNFSFKTNNLSKVIELSSLTFEGRAFEKNIKISLELEKDINMNMDTNSIKQLIEILLDNAIKHSKKGEKIKIILKKTKNNIILLVKNKGDEIKQEDQEKIFERFYRVDKSRNRKEGRYGLGLAIAKNIVINHNGTIKAYSKNGETTFEILFKI